MFRRRTRNHYSFGRKQWGFRLKRTKGKVFQHHSRNRRYLYHSPKFSSRYKRGWKRKHFYKPRWKKDNGLPLYVRHKRTGMKFTLFGIRNKDRVLKDLYKKGFERISFKEYYRKR